MRQAQLVGARSFRLDEAPVPEPAGDEVLVKVRACGVCASELPPYESGEGVPRLLGHEVAGDIVALGERVRGLEVGQCVTGLFQNGFSQFAMTTAEKVLPIPEGISPVHAHGEPLACAVSAARRTRVDLGDRVAIVGLGFMGLLMLQLIARKGPSHILGIDPRRDARQAAMRLGCDWTLRPERVEPSQKVVLPYQVGTRDGYDVVVEATGTQAGLTLASELVNEHGFLSILGYHQGGPREVDMKLWNFKAIDVLNAHERRVDWRMESMRRGLELAATGRIDLEAITTHIFSLDKIDDAFAALVDKPDGFIKSVVVP
jgi:threonine dehydrogenase-like Zn-dependent dehydrogenase